MHRKLKVAILALLGFSVSCSAVREGASSKRSAGEREDTNYLERIRVMYGTPRPVGEQAGGVTPMSAPQQVMASDPQQAVASEPQQQAVAPEPQAAVSAPQQITVSDPQAQSPSGDPAPAAPAGKGE